MGPFRSLGPFWVSRLLLGVAAAVLILSAISLRDSVKETTEVTETSFSQPAQPSPTAHTSPSPLQASGPTSTKTTTTKAAGSDTFTLGVLTLGVFLALAAVFYNRLSKLTGPGGFGFELTPAEQATSAQKVADILGRRAATRPASLQRGQPLFEMYSLVNMATESGAHKSEDVAASVVGTATQAGKATSLAQSYAATLKRLALQSPADLKEVALAWGIPSSEIGDLVAGRITDSAWSALAARAVDQISQS